MMVEDFSTNAAQAGDEARRTAVTSASREDDKVALMAI